MSRLARFSGFDGHPDTDAGEPPGTGVGSSGSAAGDGETGDLRETIVAELRKIKDPEIPVNIYDLGLIYRIDIADNGDVELDMTLTAPACPVAGIMPAMVEDAVKGVPGVHAVKVALVWDPPWSQESMSEEARLELGLM